MNSIKVTLRLGDRRPKVGELFELENKVVFKIKDIMKDESNKEDNCSNIILKGIFVNYMTMYEVMN